MVTTCLSIIINLTRRICQFLWVKGNSPLSYQENSTKRNRLRRTACTHIDQFKLLMIIKEKKNFVMQLAKKILENCILFLPSQCNTNVHNSDHNNITFSFTYIKAKIKLISLGHDLKTLNFF